MPHRPVILGIVGDSAAGKTTLAAGIARILGPDQVTSICVDDYHRYNRAQRKELAISPLNPECNYMDIMEQHMRCLADGEPVLKPVYNHRTGDFDPPEYIKPKKFLIVDGLLGFFTQKLRDIYHVKVYLDPPEELRRLWKIKRDCTVRGYTPEEVDAELVRREPDAAAFIRPQCRWGDLVVRFHAPPGVPPAGRLSVRVHLRSTLLHPDLTEVAKHSNNGQPAVRLTVGRDEGRLTEFLDIDGTITVDQAMSVEDTIWAHMPGLQHLRHEQIGHFLEGKTERQSDPLGLTQLLIAYHLLLARAAKDQILAQGVAPATGANV